MKALRIFLNDARNFQYLSLFVFMVYGLFYFGWEKYLSEWLIIIIVCLATQFLALKLIGQNGFNLKSALITAFGLCLLLRSDQLWVLAMAAFLAISSKFVLRINNKHLFNPANFGIISTVLLTKSAWVSVGQWGNESIYLWFVLFFGLAVLIKSQRLDTSLAFLGSFSLFICIYVVFYLGDSWSILFHKLGNGTLLIFSFYMITDPMTTPNHKGARVIWAIFIAFLSFWLITQNFFFSAPLWILFFISPFTFFIDKVFKANKFKWYEN